MQELFLLKAQILSWVILSNCLVSIIYEENGLASFFDLGFQTTIICSFNFYLSPFFLFFFSFYFIWVFWVMCIL
jgi:hypothetical protein